SFGERGCPGAVANSVCAIHNPSCFSRCLRVPIAIGAILRTISVDTSDVFAYESRLTPRAVSAMVAPEIVLIERLHFVVNWNDGRSGRIEGDRFDLFTGNAGLHHCLAHG